MQNTASLAITVSSWPPSLGAATAPQATESLAFRSFSKRHKRSLVALRFSSEMAESFRCGTVAV